MTSQFKKSDRTQQEWQKLRYVLCIHLDHLQRKTVKNKNSQKKSKTGLNSFRKLGLLEDQGIFTQSEIKLWGPLWIEVTL